MSNIRILQSHADRIFLLMDQLAAQIALRKAMDQWEIEQLREEIKRREALLNEFRTTRQ